jgi:hypothetical protein
MAAEEINAKGGINGQKVVAGEARRRGKNERGAQIMQEFLDKEKVVAVLGPINTGVADNSTRYANERKVPVYHQRFGRAKGERVLRPGSGELHLPDRRRRPAPDRASGQGGDRRPQVQEARPPL